MTKVMTLLPFTSIINQALNSGHLATRVRPPPPPPVFIFSWEVVEQDQATPSPWHACTDHTECENGHKYDWELGRGEGRGWVEDGGGAAEGGGWRERVGRSL